MPKFDAIYPEMKPHDQVEYQGSFLVKMTGEGPCWNCHESTTYADGSFWAPLCSTECFQVKWQEYAEACRNMAQSVTADMSVNPERAFGKVIGDDEESYYIHVVIQVGSVKRNTPQMPATISYSIDKIPADEFTLDELDEEGVMEQYLAKLSQVMEVYLDWQRATRK